MSEKCSTFVGGMEKMRLHRIQQACRMFCVLGVLCWVMCGLSSCGWQDAQEVIAMADSLDRSEHVIYSDTAALSKAIRCLDNPFGRVMMRNTLGKAYYYMGRNYSLSNQIPNAADCYIEADRLRIVDPICRGRINSNMGYICTQNNSDSLALIFYERASEDFKESGNEWRYAHSLLDRIEFNVKLHHYIVADSLLQVAQTYSLDSAYQARYYETRGLYHYEQQQYDSALVQFQRGLDYWQSETEKCFSYLKIMQSYYFRTKDINSAIPYAKLIVKHSTNPNYLINAYYCLMQDAKTKNDTPLLSLYAHAREDANRLHDQAISVYAEATPKLVEYLQNPHPWRWVWITLSVVVAVCILLAIGIWIYRQRSQTQEKDFLYQQSLLEFEKGLTEIMDKYHSPRNYWRNYANLKKDIAPWLRNWTAKLDTLPLSEQEKIFCTISLIYPNLSDIEIANYLCYAKGTIRVFKNRILRKLDIPSSEFTNFLHSLSNCK